MDDEGIIQLTTTRRSLLLGAEGVTSTVPYHGVSGGMNTFEDLAFDPTATRLQVIRADGTAEILLLHDSVDDPLNEGSSQPQMSCRPRNGPALVATSRLSGHEHQDPKP